MAHIIDGETNPMKLAKKRYDSFKERGFIAVEGNLSGKDVWQAFVKEASADLNGKTSHNPWGAKVYSEKFGTDVSYEGGETYEELEEEQEDKKQQELEMKLEYFKDQVRNALSVTDDLTDMLERYGSDIDLAGLDSINSFGELRAFINQLTKVQIFMFRDKKGRNKRTESGDVEGARDLFLDELNDIYTNVQEAEMEALGF